MAFNVQAFDRKAYENVYAKSLATLIDSEKITKGILRDMSRSVLEAFHVTEDVAFLNRLVDVLTPVNKRVTIKYFQAFSGFHFSEENGTFTKKDKKVYAEKRELAEKFLEDINNNIWSWSERHIEIEPKEFKIEDVTAYMTRVMKKAEKAQLKPVDVLRAVMAAGIDMDTIMALMDEMGYDVVTE